MRTIILTAMILSGLFLLHMPAAAADSEGTVKALRSGKIERFEQNGWKNLSQGAAVRLGDRVRTDAKAVAVIEFASLGKIVIGPSSELELGREPTDFNSRLNRGSVWMNAKLPKGGTATISTTLATAGVRSTSFAVLASKDFTDVCTCEGLVTVSVFDGSAIDVKDGQQLVVTPNTSRISSGYKAVMKSGSGRNSSFCLVCHLKGGGARLKPGWN